MSRVLIVDDDPWIIRMVSMVLAHRGHTFEKSSNGEEALQKALSFRPDLIITDVMMPQMDGWAFVRTLRHNPQFALTPVIFLTALDSEEDRIQGFRLGADDYLTKPFHFEELELRVEKVLRRGQETKQQASQFSGQHTPQLALNGNLEHLGVSAILTIMELEKKTGLLVLKGPYTSRIFLRQGRLLSATFQEKPEPRNAEAIYEVLTWNKGTFEFSSLDVDMEDQIQNSTTHLLMEGARLIDEREHEKK